MAEGAQAAPSQAMSDTPGATPLRLSRTGRAALVVASAAILALAVGIWLRFLWGVFHGSFGQYDFSSYYAAAAALRADLHVDIYSAAVIAHSGAVGHVQVQPPLPYTYPPLLAIALVPLTVFPFHIAARLWTLGNVVLWLGSALLLAYELRRLLRPVLATAPATGASGGGAGTRADSLVAEWRAAWADARDDPSGILALAAAAALCLPFAPAQQTVLTGQMNFLVLLPLALIPWLTRARHERWVGVAVGLTAMLKFTPALLLVYLALRRRWEALAAAGITLVALALASMAVVGPGVFFAAVPEALRVGSGDAQLGHNEALLASVMSLLLGTAPGLAPALRVGEYVVLAALAAGLGGVIWRVGRAGGRDRATGAAENANDTDDVTYAVALCALLLLAPAAWVHHYVWVLPAAALVLGLAARTALSAPQAARRRAACVLLGCAALASLMLGWSLPSNWDTEPRPTPATSLLFALRPLALELRALGTVLLVGAAIVLLRWGQAAARKERRTPS